MKRSRPLFSCRRIETIHTRSFSREVTENPILGTGPEMASPFWFCTRCIEQPGLDPENAVFETEINRSRGWEDGLVQLVIETGVIGSISITFSTVRRSFAVDSILLVKKLTGRIGLEMLQ